MFKKCENYKKLNYDIITEKNRVNIWKQCQNQWDINFLCSIYNMYDCTCLSSYNDHEKEIWVMNYWSKKRKDGFSSDSADLSKMIRWENMKDLC